MLSETQKQKVSSYLFSEIDRIRGKRPQGAKKTVGEGELSFSRDRNITAQYSLSLSTTSASLIRISHDSLTASNSRLRNRIHTKSMLDRIRSLLRVPWLFKKSASVGRFQQDSAEQSEIVDRVADLGSDLGSELRSIAEPSSPYMAFDLAPSLKYTDNVAFRQDTQKGQRSSDNKSLAFLVNSIAPYYERILQISMDNTASEIWIQIPADDEETMAAIYMAENGANSIGDSEVELKTVVYEADENVRIPFYCETIPNIDLNGAN